MFCLSVAFYEVPIIYAIRLLRTDLLLASCILVACTHILRYLSTIVYTFWILVDNIKCVCNSAWDGLWFRSLEAQNANRNKKFVGCLYYYVICILLRPNQCKVRNFNLLKPCADNLVLVITTKLQVFYLWNFWIWKSTRSALFGDLGRVCKILWLGL